MLSHVSSAPPPPESLFFGWTCLEDLCSGDASNAERGGNSRVANARRDGGERREGERTTSSPPSAANRDRTDTQYTYDSCSWCRGGRTSSSLPPCAPLRPAAHSPLRSHLPSPCCMRRRHRTDPQGRSSQRTAIQAGAGWRRRGLTCLSSK